MRIDRRFAVALAIILITGVLARSLTLRYGTFMEPDSYDYYSIAQQTVANGLVITSMLSGFPVHNPYNEQPGLVYMAIAFSYITQNLFTAMLILPVIFGLFEILAVYVLTLQLSGNRYASLFAAFLFATMPGAIYKNVAGEWRGESFVPLFIAAVLILIIHAYEKKDRRFYLLSIIPLALALWTWKGGVYVIAVMLALLILMIVYRKTRSIVVSTAVAALLSIAGYFAFESIIYSGIYTVTTALNTIAELQPTTASFLVIEFGLAIGLVFMGILIYVLKEKTGSKAGKKRNVAFLAILSLFLVTIAMQIAQVRWETLVAMPIAIFSGYAVIEFYNAPQKKTIWIKLFVALAIIVDLALMLTNVPFYSPANHIDPQFVATMVWIRNNTPANATFLTDWTDGSVVEGLGLRQSYSDSVMGIANGWQEFPRFLYAEKGNLSYLQQIKPSYVLVQKFWLDEAGALAVEGSMPSNMSINGTNFAALENGSTFQSGNIVLNEVYKNNDTIIYKVYNKN